MKKIFLGGRAAFSHVIETKLDGQAPFRLDYSVPLAQSDYYVHAARGGALVVYGGSFWAARNTLDLMRLTIAAKIPQQLGVTFDETFIDYGLLGIRETPFLLPLRATWITQDIRGAEVRNEISFNNCREFVSESILNFD